MLKLDLGAKFLFYELTDFLLSFSDLIINPRRLTFTQLKLQKNKQFINNSQ